MTKIGSKQLFALTFFTTIALFIGFGNPLLLKNAGNSTLVACLIGVVLGLLILLLILYIANNTNFTNFFKGLEEKNKVIGNILSFLFIIFALYIFLNPEQESQTCHCMDLRFLIPLPQNHPR